MTHRLLILLAVTLALAGCRSKQPPQAGNGTGPANLETGSLPNRALTPGATLPVTKDDICVPGYSKKVRNVPSSVKSQVYEEYGIQSHKPKQYEVDHLISLELGGSNNVKNLWPEPYDIDWGAHVKDALENRLHDLVCTGRLDLATAQQEISTDWISAYKKHFNTQAPLAKHHEERQRRRNEEGEGE